MPPSLEMSAVQSSKKGRVILSVDDNALLRLTRRKILEAEGYIVLSAADGEEALSLFDGAAIDLVVLDLYMPGIDGLGVAQKMKAQRPLVPIILVSGRPAEEETPPWVDWVFVKGDDLGLLISKVQQLLGDDETRDGDS